MPYVYRNRYTQQRVERQAPVPRFDRSERWELVEQPPKQSRKKKTTSDEATTDADLPSEDGV